jgi:hypothetical protein
MSTISTYPTAKLVLMPRELDVIIDSLTASMEDNEQFDEHALAAELALLIRKLDRAAKSLITH